jgi:hypothetical protein
MDNPYPTAKGTKLETQPVRLRLECATACGFVWKLWAVTDTGLSEHLLTFNEGAELDLMIEHFEAIREELSEPQPIGTPAPLSDTERADLLDWAHSEVMK